jgi:ribosomal protein S18 acetylase RimI-like enzyme
MASHEALTFTVHDEVPPDAGRLVDDGLGAANAAAAPVQDVRPLSCFARSASGAVVGGVVGRTWGECCEVQQVWVDADLRKAGIGAALVRRFERHAQARGCRTFYLDTFSFQAPDFYRRLGYEVALVVEGYAPGIARCTMVRRVPAEESAPGTDASPAAGDGYA